MQLATGHHRLFAACCKNRIWELTALGYTRSYRTTKNIERRPSLGRSMKMMAAVSEWGTIMSGPYFRCMLAMATSWLIRQSSPATGAVRGAEQHHWDERKRVAYQQHHYFYSRSSVLPALNHLYSVHSPPNHSWSFNSATTHSRNVCLKGDVFGTMEKVILFFFYHFVKMKW